MTARDWLAKRAELEAAATEGPWEAPEATLGVAATTVLGPECTHALYHSRDHGTAAWVADARTSAPAMRKALEAVLEMHHRVGIYDECECPDDEKEAGGHEDIYEVGSTCNRLYDICDECCREDVYQTEDCANHHPHSLDGDYCATVTAITAALEPTP